MNIKILKTCKLCKCSGEKKYFSLFLFVFSALLSSFAFLSCDGIAQKIDGGGYSFLNNEQEFIITGTLSVDGAVPSEIAKNNLAYAEKSAENESENAKIAESKNARSISGDFESGRGLSGRSARTAFPSIQTPSSYTVSATSGNRNVQGEVEQSGKFTIKLSSGTWTVKAEGYSDSTMNTKILEGSTKVTLNANTVDNNISIMLSPISSGSGKIDLTVNFDGTTGINNVEMILTKAGSNQRTITGSGSTGNQRKLTRENIESGVYDAEIKFKSSSGELKYSTHEMVNVFQNLTTDTWSGSTSYLKGGQFLVTKARVDGFTNRKEFYVQGTSETTYTPTTTASDNNSGTYFDPFATIQKAVDTINSINDGRSTYKIIVDGTLTITSDTATSAVIIQPDKNLNLTIESHSTTKATVKANSNGMRVFIVGNGGNTSITPNVTMKNLIITGGNNGTGGGAGIKLEAGSLTLSSVEVKDNKTTDIGGGICVEKDASLTINEGSKISNNSAENGGGIYVRRDSVVSSGILNITNSEISGNTATDRGGGIFVDSGGCTINGGTISENSAESNGGGIFVDGGRCTINGGVISNNKAASKGGGVCVAVLGSSITITGTTTMSGNQLTDTAQKETGTAIFVSKGATAELDGSSGNINITQGIAQGGALPTIYLEKGASDPFRIQDAVLKLGGNVQIGNGNGTGINIEGKINQAKANIMITAELTSTQIINISYATTSGEAIIEGEGNYNLTEADCNKFRVNSKALDFENNKGIYKQ